MDLKDTVRQNICKVNFKRPEIVHRGGKKKGKNQRCVSRNWNEHNRKLPGFGNSYILKYNKSTHQLVESSELLFKI